MTTPIETAARALCDAWDAPALSPTDRDDARTVLGSLAQHRDDIADAIEASLADTCPTPGGGCDCPDTARIYAITDALLSYLTKEQ